MGRRGQAKKSCTHCIRRKVRCDLSDQKRQGNQKCSACQRRRQECLEETRLSATVPNDSISMSATSSSHSHSQTNTSHTPDTTGVKGLTLQQIETAFHAFYSSNCFLSRILIHWKSMLQPLLVSFSFMNPLDPTCILLKAILSHGLTLDPTTSVRSLSSKTEMVYHLRSSLESIMVGEAGDLDSFTISHLNALLASCTILQDLWPDTEIFYPASILPQHSDGEQTQRPSVLKHSVDHVAILSRLMENILFEERGFSSQNNDDVGACSHNLLLYLYIFLIDAFSESYTDRRPFVNADTVTLLEKYIDQQKENVYDCPKNSPMTKDEIDARNQTGKVLFNLVELAKISRQIASARKLAGALEGTIGKEELRKILKQLHSWETSHQAKMIMAIKKEGEPLGYCIEFLYRYSYLRLHVLARGCKTFESTGEDGKLFRDEIRSSSLYSWQRIVGMMEELEKERIEAGIRHILLSQSRLMIYSILDCIYWGLRRLSIEKDLVESEEATELQEGSDRMLFMLNCYSGQDVCLGLDVLDFMSKLEQLAYKEKSSQQKGNVL